jgi:hypothetical protein
VQPTPVSHRCAAKAGVPGTGRSAIVAHDAARAGSDSEAQAQALGRLHRSILSAEIGIVNAWKGPGPGTAHSEVRPR